MWDRNDNDLSGKRQDLRGDLSSRDLSGRSQPRTGERPETKAGGFFGRKTKVEPQPAARREQQSDRENPAPAFDDQAHRKQRSESAPGLDKLDFQFNQPTVIILLYLASFFMPPLPAILGLALAYTWRNARPEHWQMTHFTYQIRTFWFAFAGFAIGAATIAIGIGMLVWLAAFAQMLIRNVKSLVAAQKQEPMPDPNSWTV